MHEFVMVGFWWAREEDAQSCARRCLRMFSALSEIHPVFHGWQFYDEENERWIPFFDPLEISELTSWVIDGITRFDDGRISPKQGYTFAASTAGQSHGARVIIRAGAFGKMPIPNRVSMTIHHSDKADPLISYRTVKAIMLAVAEVWDVDWSWSAPFRFPTDYGDGPKRSFHAAWVTYLSAPFAKNILPPRSAVIERQANGGLLLAATKENFDTANPAHVAATEDILACLAPALPVLQKSAADPP